LGIGPRGAGGCGSSCLKRPVARYGSSLCCSQVVTFCSEKARDEQWNEKCR
jgi:hypothetical protein